MENKVIFITGPTSSGKTKLAVDVAKKYNGEIISADSRQVYVGMDIGTGKEGVKSLKSKVKSDSRIDFIKSRVRFIEGIPQYLIDIIEPGGMPVRSDCLGRLARLNQLGGYNLAQFLKDAKLILNDIWRRGKLPIVAGGTGLYISALLKGYQLSTVERRPGRGNWNKKNKPKFSSILIARDLPREQLYKKIDQRLRDRLNQGIVGEVEGLIAKGVDPAWLVKIGLEYRFVTMYLNGEIKSQQELYDKLRYAIHAYARRQLTWIRHQLRGTEWVSSRNEAYNKINQFLFKQE